SFEQVKAFYAADHGSAGEESETERKRYAFFEYMNAGEVDKYDPPGAAIGVSIYSNTLQGDKTTRVVDEIFDKFKMLMAQNQMTQDEYSDMVGKYAHLATWYYPPFEEVNRQGKPLLMDQVIGSRCEKNSGQEKARRDAEKMGAKVQELMMQGRQREALELLQEMGQASQDVITHSLSPEGVKRWEECLKELSRSAFPTRFTIAADPSKS
ncbi:MAG: hypothetical protein ABR523_08325, partial [Desulfurivibrionaceae bacterium]